MSSNSLRKYGSGNRLTCGEEEESAGMGSILKEKLFNSSRETELGHDLRRWWRSGRSGRRSGCSGALIICFFTAHKGPERSRLTRPPLPHSLTNIASDFRLRCWWWGGKRWRCRFRCRLRRRRSRFRCDWWRWLGHGPRCWLRRGAMTIALIL